MLTYKFYVSTTGRILNDASKLPPYLYYVKFISKKLVSNENSKSECNIKDQSKPYDTCRQNAEVPIRCPKKTLFHLCCRKSNALSEVRLTFFHTLRYVLDTYTLLFHQSFRAILKQ